MSIAIINKKWSQVALKPFQSSMIYYNNIRKIFVKYNSIKKKRKIKSNVCPNSGQHEEYTDPTHRINNIFLMSVNSPACKRYKYIPLDKVDASNIVSLYPAS